MSNQFVPWYDSEEWLRVHDQLFSTVANADTKRSALHTLMVWKARSPALASGIESTLSLLEVAKDEDTASDRVLRLAYSAALTRFVNHMLDAEQARGLTLYHAARNAGLPDWVIDLRHTAAHGDSLPSLDLLRRAALIALDWLRKNYWDPQKELISDYYIGAKSLHPNEKKLSQLISFCASLSIYQWEPKIKNLTQIPDPEAREAILEEARELFEGTDFTNPKEVAISSLMDIATSHATKLLKQKDAASVVARTLIEPNSLFLSLEVLSLFNENLFRKEGLDRRYVLSWEVLLTFLHTHGLLASLVCALVEVTRSEEREESVRRLSALWTREILRAVRRSKLYIEKLNKMNSRKTDSSPSIKRNRILYQQLFPNEKRNLTLNLTKPVPEEFTNIYFVRPIVSSYNPYLSLFMKDLLMLLEPKLSNDKVERLQKLASLASGQNLSHKSGSQDKVFTVHAVEASDSPRVNGNGDSADSDCMEVDVDEEWEGGIWKLVPDQYNWAECPLGALPWNIKVAPV